MSFIDPKQIELTEEIGHGSTGSSFDNKQVAIKKFYSSCPLTREKYFKNELAILQKINHSNIVKILGYCDNKKNTFLVYELMEGKSLYDLIKNPGKPIKNKLNIIKGIINGMEYLHNKSILHLDLKSPNILLNRDKNDCKISDFGLSKITSLSQITEPEKNKINTARGSVRWMSPEISKGFEGTMASDVWSFGCILVEFATRKIPFEGLPNHSVIDMLQDDKAEIPIQIDNPSLVISSLIVKCLKRNPKKRPSFQELNKKLKNCSPDYFNTNLKSCLTEDKSTDNIKTVGDLSLVLKNVKNFKTVTVIQEKIDELEKKLDNIRLEYKKKDTLLPIMTPSPLLRQPYRSLLNKSVLDRSQLLSPLKKNFKINCRTPGPSNTKPVIMPINDLYVTKGSGRQIYEGIRGGKFMFTPNGKKRFV